MAVAAADGLDAVAAAALSGGDEGLLSRTPAAVLLGDGCLGLAAGWELDGL